MTIRLVVHQFTVGDVEDPDLYAAEPLWKWEQSEAGQFVMERAVEKPSWYQRLDMNTFGYRYEVVADLLDPDATFFQLKYGNHNTWPK